jgi:hypothetical protein
LDWQKLGDAKSIISWLEDASNARYASERRLDPFATSMRNFDDVSPNLKAIRSGQNIGTNDPRQRITDLSGAGFVDADKLTPLGLATINAWEEFDVDTSQIEDEFARHLILVFEAEKLSDVYYRQFFEYWSDIRANFDPIEMIDSWDSLYALNYLDFERVSFIPGRRYREFKVSPNDIEFDLDEFVQSVGASANAISGADRLATAIAGKIARGRHRATFCAALEVVLGGETSLTQVMARFGIPKKPQNWTPFTNEQKEQVKSIAAKYAKIDVVIPIKPNSVELKVEAATLDLDEEHQTTTITNLPAEIDFGNVIVDPPVVAVKTKDQSSTEKLNANKKIDHKKKAAKNETVGALGEEFALRFENWRLKDHPALAAKIVHVSKTDDSKGYDILSFETNGDERYVEVKTTFGNVATPFFISSAELAVAEKIGKKYVILRVHELDAHPKCFEIRSPFEGKLILSPTTYLATFK